VDGFDVGDATSANAIPTKRQHPAVSICGRDPDRCAKLPVQSCYNTRCSNQSRVRGPCDRYLDLLAVTYSGGAAQNAFMFSVARYCSGIQYPAPLLSGKNVPGRIRQILCRGWDVVHLRELPIRVHSVQRLGKGRARIALWRINIAKFLSSPRGSRRHGPYSDPHRLVGPWLGQRERSTKFRRAVST